jgi:hypothetical protein
VASTDAHVLCISDAKIDVPDIQTIGRDDAEVEIRNEPTGRLAGHDPAEKQGHLAS